MGSLISPVLWPLTPSCGLWPSGQSQEPSRCILFVIIVLKHIMYHKRVFAARWESNPRPTGVSSGPSFAGNERRFGRVAAKNHHLAWSDSLCQKFQRARGSVMCYWSSSSPLRHDYNDGWCGNFSRVASMCCFVVWVFPLGYWSFLFCVIRSVFCMPVSCT